MPLVAEQPRTALQLLLLLLEAAAEEERESVCQGDQKWNFLSISSNLAREKSHCLVGNMARFFLV